MTTVNVNQSTEGKIAEPGRIVYVSRTDADVAELADAQVLGACGEIREGSSPSVRSSIWAHLDTATVTTTCHRLVSRVYAVRTD